MSALPQIAATCSESIRIEDFERGDVDAEQFDHEAHVYALYQTL